MIQSSRYRLHCAGSQHPTFPSVNDVRDMSSSNPQEGEGHAAQVKQTTLLTSSVTLLLWTPMLFPIFLRYCLSMMPLIFILVSVWERRWRRREAKRRKAIRTRREIKELSVQVSLNLCKNKRRWLKVLLSTFQHDIKLPPEGFSGHLCVLDEHTQPEQPDVIIHAQRFSRWCHLNEFVHPVDILVQGKRKMGKAAL